MTTIDTPALLHYHGQLIEANALNMMCELLTDDGKVLTLAFPEILKPRIGMAFSRKVDVYAIASEPVQIDVSEPLQIRQITVDDGRKPLTAQALIDLGFFELGEGRDDLGDIHDEGRRLRERTWSKGGK